MTDWAPVPGVYAADSPIHGRGLYAAEPMAAGDHVGRYEGQRTEENGMHVLWVEGEQPGDWIGYDGTNLLRFLNHSKHPNAELDGQELYAIGDIQRGEEITIDYGEWFEADE